MPTVTNPVTVDLTIPTTFTDGMPIPPGTITRLEYGFGTAHGTYTVLVSDPVVAAKKAYVPAVTLEAGTWYGAARLYTKDGPGPWGNERTVAVTARIPKAITDMQLTAVRTLTSPLPAPALSASVAGSTATLSWTPPIPTGQSVIAGYRLYKGPTAGSQTTLVGTFTGTSTTDALPATQFYRIEAFDQFQPGLSSSAVSCSPIVTGSIRSTPGDWLELDTGGTGDVLGRMLSQCDFAAANGFVGVFWIFTLNKLEGATAGDYSNGFVYGDAISARCLSLGLAWGLGWQDRTFGTRTYSGSATPGQAGLPAYWQAGEFEVAPSGLANGWGGIGGMARWDRPYSIGRYVALATAWYARYGTTIEMWRGPESAVSGTFISNTGYSNANGFAQLALLYPQLRTAMPAAELTYSLNFSGSDTLMQNVLAAFAGANCMAGGLGPDQDLSTFPSNRAHNGNIGGTSYVGVLPCIAEMQFPDMSQTSFTAQQVDAFCWSGAVASGGSVKPTKWLWFNWTGAGLNIASVIASRASRHFTSARPTVYA